MKYAAFIGSSVYGVGKTPQAAFDDGQYNIRQMGGWSEVQLNVEPATDDVIAYYAAKGGSQIVQLRTAPTRQLELLPSLAEAWARRFAGATRCPVSGKLQGGY